MTFAQRIQAPLTASLLLLAATAQAQTPPPVAAPPPAEAPAAADPQRLALSQQIFTALAVPLNLLLAKACESDNMLGKARSLPDDQKAKARAAAQPICVSGLEGLKGSLVESVARTFPVEDLQALLTFITSPAAASIMASFASGGGHPDLTADQKSALQAFVKSPAGQDIARRGPQLIPVLQAQIVPQMQAIQARAQAAACAAGGCAAAPAGPSK